MTTEEAMALTFGLSHIVIILGFIVFFIIDKFKKRITKGDKQDGNRDINN